MRRTLETILIGALIMNPIADARHVQIEPDDFINDNARAVFEAMIQLREAGVETDVALIGAKAKEIDKNFNYAYCSEAINATVSSKNYIAYANELRKAIYFDKVEELKRRSVSELNSAEDMTKALDALRIEDQELKNKYMTTVFANGFPDAMASMLHDVETKDGPKKLFKTRVPFLEELSGGGWLGAELIILAARPGCGKTAMAMQIMEENGILGEISSFFSLEMTEKQVSARNMAYFAHVDTRKVTRNPSALTDTDRATIAKFGGHMLTVSENIFLHDKAGQDMSYIRSQAREDVANGAVIIVIDYLQRFAIDGESRNDGVGRISNQCQDMGKELGVPVLLLCQLSRDVEKQKRLPVLSDLRDSGSIEQDGNIIIFLHKLDEFLNGFNAMCIQAKSRDGAIGFVPVVFQGLHQKFYRRQGAQN